MPKYIVQVKKDGNWVPYNEGVGEVRTNFQASQHSFDEAAAICILLNFETGVTCRVQEAP